MGLHDGHRQRMKERFARHGLDSFAEHEVLELLLYYAIPRRDTNELAHTLLDRFGSLERVLLAPREELMKVPGVGEGAALLLTLVPAVSQYTHRHAPQETILNSVDASGRYFMRLLRHERRELLYQACLDGKGKLLSCRCLSEGRRHAAPDRGARAAQRRVERPARAQPSERHRPPLRVRPADDPAGARRARDDGHPSHRPHHRRRRRFRLDGAERPFAIRQRIGFLSESDSLSYWLIAPNSAFLCAAHKNTPSPRRVFFATYTSPQKTDFSLFAAFRPRTL